MKYFLLPIIVLFILFSPKPVWGAQSQNVFFDDFLGTTFDSDKWDTSMLLSGSRWCAADINQSNLGGNWFNPMQGSCHNLTQQPPFGQIVFNNSEVTFTSGLVRAFPYVWSKISSSPFPGQGDFTFETRMKYNSAQAHGAGAIALQSTEQLPGGTIAPPLDPAGELFSLWLGRWPEDGTTTLKASVLGESKVIVQPLAYHTYRLEYIDKKYSLYIDDQLQVNPKESNLRPSVISLGNPFFSYWNVADWSDFTIDYIKVTKPIVSESTPEPFLDLPWDYQSKGKSFEEVALNPNSWFDHQYPLQNSCCQPPVLLYNGASRNDAYYRSHSGYDYGIRHGVYFNTPVLAAAAGWATFIPSSHSGGAGNMIKIDHENGYQTWYEHLRDKTTILQRQGEKVFVTKGQEIGRTGFTGNAYPQDERGAHIHFSVFRDHNKNGSFNDDYPYGFVDPLGWSADYVDPWTIYGTGDKTGSTSYPLFLAQVKQQKVQISQGDAELKSGKAKVNISSGTLSIGSQVTLEQGPFAKQGDRFDSLGPSLILHAFSAGGQSINQFTAPIRLSYDYSSIDLFNLKENTLHFYYFNSVSNAWEQLSSQVNTNTQQVSTETTHFSEFAVMGEIKDATAPITEIVMKGESGQSDWYRSTVKVTLQPTDQQNGLGVAYTLYKINDGDWQEYKEPFELTTDGEYKIGYLSFDKAGNAEEEKTKVFNIDLTVPEVEISYILESYDVLLKGKDTGVTKIAIQKLSPLKQKYLVSDMAGNILSLVMEKRKLGKQVSVSIESMQYNSRPVIKPDKNIFFTLFTTDKKDKINLLDQYFMVKSDKRIFTHYLSKVGKTVIFVKKKGEQYTREEKSGLVLLQLLTQNGTLKYSY